MNHLDFVRPKTMALWAFDDEDGTDSGPNGYHLTTGHLDYSLGRFGACGYFDGNNYLRSNTNLPQLAQAIISVCFWMKSNFGSEQYIFSNVYTWVGNTYGYNIGTTADDQLFYEGFPGDGYGYRVKGGPDVTDNGWRWIVITRGATYTRFYIDGCLEYTVANPPLGFNGREYACIGAWWYQYNNAAYDHYSGYLDELHLLNLELSAATIRKMYAFQMGWL